MKKLKSVFNIFKKKCSQCSNGRLQLKDWVQATCINEKGERYPDSWSYYECDKCGYRLKVYINGKIEEPTDEEWVQY